MKRFAQARIEPNGLQERTKRPENEEDKEDKEYEDGVMLIISDGEGKAASSPPPAE